MGTGIFLGIKHQWHDRQDYMELGFVHTVVSLACYTNEHIRGDPKRETEVGV